MVQNLGKISKIDGYEMLKFGINKFYISILRIWKTKIKKIQIGLVVKQTDIRVYKDEFKELII